MKVQCHPKGGGLYQRHFLFYISKLKFQLLGVPKFGIRVRAFLFFLVIFLLTINDLCTTLLIHSSFVLWPLPPFPYEPLMLRCFECEPLCLSAEAPPGDGFHYANPLRRPHRGILSEAHSCRQNRRKPRSITGRQTGRCRGAAGFCWRWGGRLSSSGGCVLSPGWKSRPCCQTGTIKEVQLIWLRGSIVTVDMFSIF